MSQPPQGPGTPPEPEEVPHQPPHQPPQQPPQQGFGGPAQGPSAGHDGGHGPGQPGQPGPGAQPGQPGQPGGYGQPGHPGQAPHQPHQQPNPYQGQQPPQAGPLSPGEEQGWGVGIHLGGAFFSWLAPLIIWLVFRERSPMINDHGKDALNWQITLFIGYVIAFVTMFIIIGFIIMPLLYIAALIFGILGAIAAYNRRQFRYPFTIKFIK